MKQALFALLIIVGGCVNGQFSPFPDQLDTQRKQLVAIEASFTGAVNAATKAVETGLIKPGTNEAVVLQGAVNGGAAALDSAHLAIQNGDVDAFTVQMSLIRAAIQTLQSMLPEPVA